MNVKHAALSGRRALQTADLVLDEGTHRVGELVQGTDAGEVPAIDGVGGGRSSSFPVKTHMTLMPL